MHRYISIFAGVLMLVGSLFFAADSIGAEGKSRQIQSIKRMLENSQASVSGQLDEMERETSELLSYVAAVKACAEVGQVYNGTACVPLGGDLDLVNGFHSSDQCEFLQGEVLEDDEGLTYCRFTASSCPIGWHHYDNWSQTSVTTCRGTGCSNGLARLWCRTGGHAWGSQTPIETCTYTTGTYDDGTANDGTSRCRGGTTATCSATISRIGCF